MFEVNASDGVETPLVPYIRDRLLRFSRLVFLESQAEGIQQLLYVSGVYCSMDATQKENLVYLIAERSAKKRAVWAIFIVADGVLVLWFTINTLGIIEDENARFSRATGEDGGNSVEWFFSMFSIILIILMIWKYRASAIVNDHLESLKYQSKYDEAIEKYGHKFLNDSERAWWNV